MGQPLGLHIAGWPVGLALSAVCHVCIANQPARTSSKNPRDGYDTNVTTPAQRAFRPADNRFQPLRASDISQGAGNARKTTHRQNTPISKTRQRRLRLARLERHTPGHPGIDPPRSTALSQAGGTGTGNRIANPPAVAAQAFRRENYRTNAFAAALCKSRRNRAIRPVQTALTNRQMPPQPGSGVMPAARKQAEIAMPANHDGAASQALRTGE